MKSKNEDPHKDAKASNGPEHPPVVYSDDFKEAFTNI